MRLEIDSLALKDVKESISYYESKAKKGAAFDAEFDVALDRVFENPLAFRVLDESGYRRCSFLKFPYGVFFKTFDDYIYIIAFGHHKRKPHFWASRGSDNGSESK